MSYRLALLALFSITTLASAAPPTKLSSFTLTDPRTELPVDLSDFADRKAVVVIFLGTVCPINNLYLHRLTEYQRDYAEQGVQLIGINSNHCDLPEDIAKHAEEHALNFPVLKDLDGHVADLFGAEKTPEVFVLDAEGTVRYQGRIDDQHGLTYRKLDPTTRELADAIAAVIAGEEVKVAKTEVEGCWIARRPKPNPTAEVSFTKDIAPLLQKNCQECHRPGQIGPMPLIEYEDVADWSESIRYAVEDRRMPPWYADPRYGHFSNDRSLSDDEVALLIHWIDQGCPEGDPADMPPAREFSSDWRIGKPDLILSMEEEYHVPAEMPPGGIPYQLFIVDPGFTEDVWVQRAEARAGAASVVHHIIAYIVPPAEYEDPDYPNFPFLLGVRNARVLAGTAPGDMPSIFPEGTASRIPAGSMIVFQMHYTPNGKAATDRSSVGLILAKEKPQREIITVPVFNARLDIPPGDPNYFVESRFTFKYDAEIFSLMPHMHLRGKDFMVNVQPPEGPETTLLSVPEYNFNWQSAYRLAEPVRVKAGDKLHCLAHFDNSERNPSNPDPTRRVRWGDQTWQEMMIGWMDMVYDKEPR